MANEISFTASLSFFKAAVTQNTVGFTINGQQFSVAGTAFQEGSVQAGTSATVIPLGGVTSPRWFVGVNMDPTNYIRLHNGSGGAKVVKLLAGDPCFFPWDDTATPYCTANSAACWLNYLVIQV